MSECELCGSKNANKKTKIDKAILTVCEKCVKYGEEVSPLQVRVVRKTLPKLEENEIVLKLGFDDMIRDARQKKNLKQEELAKKLNERASVIKRVEEGWESTPALISKLEKFFNIKLTQNSEDEKLEKKTEKKKLTIGDVVEIR